MVRTHSAGANPPGDGPQPWQFLVPEANGYCTRAGRPAHLKSLTSDVRRKAVKFSCGSWACRVCSARLRRDYFLHFAGKLLAASGVLFGQESDPASWGRDRKRLQRLRADWVRVGCVGEPGILVGEAKSPIGTAFSDREAAVERLASALADLVPVWKNAGGRTKPVCCSAGWRRPADARKFERVGWFGVRRPDEVLAVLRRFGIHGHLKSGGGSADWSITFDAPDNLLMESQLSPVSSIRTE